MNEPIKAGDRCIIIRGATGNKSPNVGKIITAGVTVGEHPQFGRMVRIHGQGLDTVKLGVLNWAEIPTAWLRKLPPVAPAAPAKRQEVTA